MTMAVKILRKRKAVTIKYSTKKAHAKGGTPSLVWYFITSRISHVQLSSVATLNSAASAYDD